MVGEEDGALPVFTWENAVRERERKRVGDGGGRKVSQGAEKGMLPLECFKGKEWKDVL